MHKVIEVVYENGVLKPTKKLCLKNGKKFKVIVSDRTLPFKPIKLKRPVSIRKIKNIRSELWKSF